MLADTDRGSLFRVAPTRATTLHPAATQPVVSSALQSRLRTRAPRPLDEAVRCASLALTATGGTDPEAALVYAQWARDALDEVLNLAES